MTVSSTLSDEALQVVGDALQGTLVDLLGLSLIGKQAHWNIVGPRFRSIHLQLDKVVDTARTYADTVAERAAALGVPPDGRPETVATSAAPQGPRKGWVQDTDVVGVLAEALETTIGQLRQRVAATADPDPDPVTQDLLIGLTAELEKHRWMFQAEDWPRI